MDKVMGVELVEEEIPKSDSNESEHTKQDAQQNNPQAPEFSSVDTFLSIQKVKDQEKVISYLASALLGLIASFLHVSLYIDIQMVAAIFLTSQVLIRSYYSEVKASLSTKQTSEEELLSPSNALPGILSNPMVQSLSQAFFYVSRFSQSLIDFSVFMFYFFAFMGIHGITLRLIFANALVQFINT